jgi:hypothetical protein
MRRNAGVKHDVPAALDDADERIALTPLAAAFMETLRKDDRFRDILADPFAAPDPTD